jgi:hypothetical protein
MDPAWFEDLKGRLMGLLIALEDRLEKSDARQVHEFIDVGGIRPGAGGDGRCSGAQADPDCQPRAL